MSVVCCARMTFNVWMFASCSPGPLLVLTVSVCEQEAHVLIGDAHMQLEQFDKAVHSFQQVRACAILVLVLPTLMSHCVPGADMSCALVSLVTTAK